MNATLIYAKTLIRRFFRDPTALFFTLLFPLLFLLVFGSLFRGDGDLRFQVAIRDDSQSVFAEQFVKQLSESDRIEMREVDSLDRAKELMGSGDVDSILELSSSFGEPNESGIPSGTLVVYYDEGSPQTGMTVASVMEDILGDVNLKLTSVEMPFSVVQRSTATANLTQFDYVFAGLLGFSMLSLGIFGLANQIPADKKNGTLRRIRATPFRSSQVIVGTMIYYGAVGMLSLILMIIAGLTIFQFDMRGDWLQVGAVMVLGLMLMLGFGLLVGGWAKNENQSSIVANVVAFPMMFLSGVFFPRFLMPEWLQGITDYLPLTPIIDSLRMIMTEGKTLLDLGPELAVIVGWIAVVYLAAIKLFRWE